MHVMIQSPASVLYALLAVTITALAVPLMRAYLRKARIARGLSPIPGPRGWPMLGMFPQLAMNAHKLNHYILRFHSWCFRL